MIHSDSDFDIQVKEPNEYIIAQVSEKRKILPSKVRHCLRLNVMTAGQLKLLTGYSIYKIRTMARGWIVKGEFVKHLNTCHPFEQSAGIFIVNDDKCEKIIIESL